MLTNFIGKIGDNTPSFVMLAFRNRLQYHNCNFKRLNSMNFSALCKFGEIWSSNPRVYAIKMITLWRHSKNCLLYQNMSEYPGSIFTKFTDLVGI